jgi:small-conductance mechanosensitive channel/CRP-like cAMP-binding protein
MISSAAAAVRDPLVATLVILLIGVLLSQFLFHRHPLRRAIVRVIFLFALSVVLLHVGVVPYQPLTLTGTPFEDAVHASLKILWWLWAAWFLVAVLRAFIVIEDRPREGKLIQDVLAGVIYLSAVFAVITYVFGVSIQGLLATSGVIAIVLGLALQSTLGDLFSGIVLNFSHPYRPRDWINIDGGTDGRVLEVNWRATNVLTASQDLAIVPNSTIAKAKIVNASSPSGTHGITVPVQLNANTPPETGAEVLQRAVLNTRPIIANPAPLVTVKSITGDATQFDIKFFVQELGHSTRAQNELLNWVFRHLAAAGIALVSAQSQPNGSPRENPKTPVERAFDIVPIFVSLSEEERKALAGKTKRKRHDNGDILVKPGDLLGSLFIIGAGVVSVTRVSSEGEIELMRAGPGDHFGEIGMLTGAASQVTLRALTPVTTHELAKKHLAPVIDARPDFSDELCHVLAQHQALGRLVATDEIDKNLPPSHLAAWFSDRLHRLVDFATVE